MIAITAPAAVLIQNSADTSSWVISDLRIVAADSPISLTKSNTVLTAVTMAMRPKADGGSNRARTATVTNCNDTFAACAPKVITPPRAER